MASANTHTAGDETLAQEADIVWLREIGIFPSAILYETVLRSPRPFTNPAPAWRAGKLWAYSVLRRDAKPTMDASGTSSYSRRIWFQIYDPRQIELEPQAAEAVRVKTSSIAPGQVSDPASTCTVLENHHGQLA